VIKSDLWLETDGLPAFDNKNCMPLEIFFVLVMGNSLPLKPFLHPPFVLVEMALPKSASI